MGELGGGEVGRLPTWDRCPRTIPAAPPVPDDGIEEGPVLRVLHEQRQQIVLQDLRCSQLLPHVAALILVPEVPDQILHALCGRGGQNTAPPPASSPPPIPHHAVPRQSGSRWYASPSR